MKAIVRLSPSSYDTGDIVDIVQDDYVLSPADLPAGQRGTVPLGALTDREINLFRMADERVSNLNAVSRIPAFKHSINKPRNMRLQRRKKYKISASNKPEKKMD